MDEHRGAFGLYLQGHMTSHDMTATDLANATGVSQSIISRWISGATKPSVENLRPVASVIGRPLLEVVVAAGILTPDEANATFVHAPATELSDDQLVAEVARRIGTAALRPPTKAEIKAHPERFVVVDPKKKDHREPSGRRRPS